VGVAESDEEITMHELLHSSALAAAQNAWIGISYVFASFAVLLFAFRWGPDTARWLGRPALFYRF
jgi:hypothetical protein